MIKYFLQHSASVISWVDDVVYASLGAYLLQYMLDNPAVAATLAGGVVLLVRGLGYLALQAAKYLQAKRLHLEAKIKEIEAEHANGGEVKLEGGLTDKD